MKTHKAIIISLAMAAFTSGCNNTPKVVEPIKEVTPITTKKDELLSFLSIPERFRSYCTSIYFKYNGDIPMKVIYNLINTESEWDETKTNKNKNGTKDSSLAQLNSSNFSFFKKEFNNGKHFDANNPYESLKIGFAYLHSLYLSFDKKIPLALAAYNAGPTKVRKGIIPQKTKEYVNKILGD